MNRTKANRFIYRASTELPLIHIALDWDDQMVQSGHYTGRKVFHFSGIRVHQIEKST